MTTRPSTFYALSVADDWSATRSGSHAGRGFRYQDAVASLIAVRMWLGDLAPGRIVPEGLNDISIESAGRWEHVQVKSRREHRGEFTVAGLGDAWRSLACRGLSDIAAKLTLVVEQPVAGLESPRDASVDQWAPDHVLVTIRDRLGELDDADPSQILSRMHVVEAPVPASDAWALLAAGLSTSPAACVAHLDRLRVALGELADANGARSADDPAHMAVHDIAHLLDGVSAAARPDLLDEAVREGVCELVDFATRVDDALFAEGVDVVPGHVVAGLTEPRTREMQELATGLATRRLSLVCGPSGAGKSALIWMAAHDVRNVIRWYRVVRLDEAATTSIVRLARAQQPAEFGSVGFVVDDIGSRDRAGFDALWSELRAVPNVVVLGACREEDLALVRSAGQAQIVRPTLGEALARRLWMRLKDDGATAWEHWHEPFEGSSGLLLEYVYLLTRAERLSAVVSDQVQRRIVEGRSLELRALALISEADRHGTQLRLAALQRELAVEDIVLRQALDRLIDEHLVNDDGSVIGGLHQVRSAAIAEAIHKRPPPMRAETIAAVVRLADASQLQTFIERCLTRDPEHDETVIGALERRFTQRIEPAAVAGALQALRVVGVTRTSREWATAIRSTGVPPTNAEVVIYFGRIGGDASMFPEPFQNAVSAVAGIAPLDLRGRLLQRARDLVSQAVDRADLSETIELLLALDGLDDVLHVSAATIAAKVDDAADIRKLRSLLDGCLQISRDLAIDVAGAIGDWAYWCDRLMAGTPWVRNLELVDDDASRIVRADFAYVAASSQPEPHDQVVDLAKYLLAFVPAADQADVRAVDATGELAGIGDWSVAEKHLVRDAVPPEGVVSWNRTMARAVHTQLAAQSTTEYATTARDLLAGLGPLARKVADSWSAGKGISTQTVKACQDKVEAAERLAPRPAAAESVKAGSPGQDSELDLPSLLATSILSNLLVDLRQGRNVAPLAQSLHAHVVSLEQDPIWGSIGGPPRQDLSALRSVLKDVYALCSEVGHSGDSFVQSLRRARHTSLGRVAESARSRVAQRQRDALDLVAREIDSLGFTMAAFERPGEADTPFWPGQETLIAVEVPTMLDWSAALEVIVARVRPLLPDGPLFLAPTRNGSVVASYGTVIHINPLMSPIEQDAWSGTGMGFLDERLAREASRALSALVEMSGIVAMSPGGRRYHHRENEAWKAADAQLTASLEALLAFHGPFPVHVHDVLISYTREVEEQARAASSQMPFASVTLAESVRGLLMGDPDTRAQEWAFLHLACIEWDVDPSDPVGRLDAAAERLRRLPDSDLDRS